MSTRFIVTHCTICGSEDRKQVVTRYGESTSTIRQVVPGCRECQEPVPGSALDRKINDLARAETEKNTLRYMRAHIAQRKEKAQVSASPPATRTHTRSSSTESGSIIGTTLIVFASLVGLSICCGVVFQ